MAVLDTHKEFEHLTVAGYSKEMAEALLDTLGESGENLATKADIRELAQGVECLRQHVDRLVSKADLCELVQMIKADLRRIRVAHDPEGWGDDCCVRRFRRCIGTAVALVPREPYPGIRHG